MEVEQMNEFEFHLLINKFILLSFSHPVLDTCWAVYLWNMLGAKRVLWRSVRREIVSP